MQFKINKFKYQNEWYYTIYSENLKLNADTIKFDTVGTVFYTADHAKDTLFMYLKNNFIIDYSIVW